VVEAAYNTYEDGTDGVPKRRHIKFRRRVITHKREKNSMAFNKIFLGQQ